MKLLKRTIALLMILAMLLSALPMYGLAENTETPDPAQTTETTAPAETTAAVETTEAADATETTAAAETTEATEAAETTEATEAAETTEATDPTETTEAPDPTETSEPAPQICGTCQKESCECCETCKKYPCACPKDCEFCGELDGHLKTCKTIVSETKEHDLAVNFTNAAPLMKDFSFPLRKARMGKAARTANESSSGNATVVLDKWVTETPDAEGNHILTMESYATGQTITIQNYKEKPADIVLVLDMSSSMSYCSHTGCAKSVYYRDASLLYGAKLNGTSDEVFTVHKKLVNNINNNPTSYRVDTGKLDPDKSYYTHSMENGVDIFKKVYYCSDCSQKAVNNKEDYANRGRWHWLENKSNHKNAIWPAQDAEAEPDDEWYFLYSGDLLLGERCISRYQMMYQALNAFVDDVVERAKGKDKKAGTEDDVAHKLGFVAFDGTNGDGVHDVAPLTDVLDKSTGGLSSKLRAAVEYYTFGTQTPTGEAMIDGVKMIKTAEDTTARNRMIILLTDGVPHPSDAANQVDLALKASYDATQNRATVYTIGIFEGANGSNPGSIVNYNLSHYIESLPNQDVKNQINSFMHLVSSNYPYIQSREQWEKRNTQAMTLNPDLKSGQGYYLSAADSAGLKNAFLQIAAGVGSQTTTSNLDSTTIVKDVVTPYFNVTPGAEITAYTMTYKGDDSQGNKTWARDAGESTLKVEPGATSKGSLTLSMAENSDGTTTVDVTGFDFGANYVGIDQHTDNGVVTNTPHGKKLMIEIKIKPDPQFLGGNHVPTNTADSGIYTPGEKEPVAKYPIPDADVITSAQASIDADINVYLGSVFEEQIGTDGQKHYGLGVADLHGVLKGGYNDVQLDFTKPNYGLDPAMDDYVNVELNIYQAKEARLGEDLSNFAWEEVPVVTMDEILWDTPYKLEIVITPKNADGECKPVKAEVVGWIYVFYPEITFHDVSTFYYGQIPTSDQIKAALGEVTIDWVNQSREGEIIYDETVTMTMPADGKIPAVTMSYSYLDNKTSLTKEDGPVEALVEQVGYVGSKNSGRINQYVHFKWTPCDPACEQSIGDHQGIARNTPEFYIHPQTCDLTITKTGGASGEPYIFDIYRNGEKYTEASITGNGSVTLSELPVGTYSVEEGTGWSWRYPNPAYSADSVVLSAEKDSGQITCTNKRDDDQWLNGYSDVVANIFGVAKKS